MLVKNTSSNFKFLKNNPTLVVGFKIIIGKSMPKVSYFSTAKFIISQ